MADASFAGDELRPEYEESVFSNAQRGKYAARFKEGANIVKLHPDVAASFPDEKSVNDALRFLQQLARDANRLTAPPVDHN